MGDDDDSVALGDEALGEGVDVHFDTAQAWVEEIGYEGDVHFVLDCGVMCNYLCIVVHLL